MSCSRLPSIFQSHPVLSDKEIPSICLSFSDRESDFFGDLLFVPENEDGFALLCRIMESFPEKTCSFANIRSFFEKHPFAGLTVFSPKGTGIIAMEERAAARKEEEIEELRKSLPDTSGIEQKKASLYLAIDKKKMELAFLQKKLDETKQRAYRCFEKKEEQIRDTADPVEKAQKERELALEKEDAEAALKEIPSLQKKILTRKKAIEKKKEEVKRLTELTRSEKETLKKIRILKKEIKSGRDGDSNVLSKLVEIFAGHILFETEEGVFKEDSSNISGSFEEYLSSHPFYTFRDPCSSLLDEKACFEKIRHFAEKESGKLDAQRKSILSRELDDFEKDGRAAEVFFSILLFKKLFDNNIHITPGISERAGLGSILHPLLGLSAGVFDKSFYYIPSSSFEITVTGKDFSNIRAFLEETDSEFYLCEPEKEGVLAAVFIPSKILSMYPVSSERAVLYSRSYLEENGYPLVKIVFSREEGLLQDVASGVFKENGFFPSPAPFQEEEALFKQIFASGRLAMVPFLSQADAPVFSSLAVSSYESLVEYMEKKQAGNGRRMAVLAMKGAWLKYHFPKEYYAESANYCSEDGLKSLFLEAQGLHVKILLPDINRSKEGFMVLNGKILTGLSFIHGVSMESARKIVKERENGKYEDFADFMVRCRIPEETVRALIRAGAFLQFSSSRGALLLVYGNIFKRVQRLSKLEEQVRIKQDALDHGRYTNKKDIENAGKSIKRNIEEMEGIRRGILQIRFPENKQDHPMDVIRMENETLWDVITRCDTDYFPEIAQSTTELSRIAPGEFVKVFGSISQIRTSVTKTSKKAYASFTLNDKSGRAKVICWPGVYAQYRELVKENALAVIYGNMVQEEGREGCYISACSMEAPRVVEHYVIVAVDRMDAWNPSLYTVYDHPPGFQVYLYGRDTGMLVKTDLYMQDVPSDGVNVSHTKSFVYSQAERKEEEDVF